MADFRLPGPLLPHPDSLRLTRGILRCAPLSTSFTGILYRVASVRRANPEDLIAGKGSLLTGGRWTPLGAFRAVYVSLDENTALDEARQQNVRQSVPTWMALPLVLTAIEVELSSVLDLTDGRIRRALRVSRKRMVNEPWWTMQDQRHEALTQAIGRLARDLGFVALLVPSTLGSAAANMVIFPDRLTPADRLTIINPDRLPQKTS